METEISNCKLILYRLNIPEEIIPSDEVVICAQKSSVEFFSRWYRNVRDHNCYDMLFISKFLYNPKKFLAMMTRYGDRQFDLYEFPDGTLAMSYGICDLVIIRVYSIPKYCTPFFRRVKKQDARQHLFLDYTETFSCENTYKITIEQDIPCVIL